MNLLILFGLLCGLMNGKSYLMTGKGARKKLEAANTIAIPVTFYLPKIYDARTQSYNYLYFNLSMCEKGLGAEEQAKLTITLPFNPTWDILNLGYVVIQLSHCAGSFTPKCVFATNYKWSPPHPPATSTLVWTLNSTNQNIYIRALSINILTEFSMEMSFVTGEKQVYYEYSSDLPFAGQTISGKQPDAFLEYWRASKIYTVKNNQVQYFQLAFCEQGNNINGMITTVSGSLKARYSLMEQWACMTNIPVSSCTQAESTLFWRNTPAGFNAILEEKDGPGKNTQNGIWVAVYGSGGEPSRNNNFSMIAQTLQINN